MAAGAVLGSVLGVAAFAAIALFGGGVGWMRQMSEFLDTPALFGAAVGALLAPLAAWTLMRHVPIWRAMLETSLGTVIGVVLGYALGPIGHLGILWPVSLGILGFLGAAVRLRFAARRPERSRPELANGR